MDAKKGAHISSIHGPIICRASARAKKKPTYSNYLPRVRATPHKKLISDNLMAIFQFTSNAKGRLPDGSKISIYENVNKQ